MNWIAIAIGVATGVLATQPTETTRAEPDALCLALFNEFILGYKVSDVDRYAATQLIVSRGRERGFMSHVLSEFRKRGELTEMRCVRILGKALEIDAVARDIIDAERRGEKVMGAWVPHVVLGPPIVAELLERASQTDRNRLDHCVIALARARDAQAIPFLSRVLSDKIASAGVRFHAAVGLAGLGEAVGVEWLIEHSEDEQDYVSNAWPAHVPDISLRTCCQYALRQISDDKSRTTKSEWREWWKLAETRPQTPKAVVLVER